MSSQGVKLIRTLTLSLLVALLCFGFLPLLSSIEISNTNKDKQEISFSGKQYNSTVSNEPAVVMRGNRQISSLIDLRLRFCITEITKNAIVFQTANLDDGIRLEVSRTPDETVRGSIIYSDNGGKHLFDINKDLEIGVPYELALKTEKPTIVSVYLNNELIGYFNDNLIVFSDFLLGTGLNPPMTFSGYAALEYGKITIASTLEKTIAWIEYIFPHKLFLYAGYLFLIIGLLALINIFEIVFFTNKKLPIEYPVERYGEAIRCKVRRLANSRYWESISSLIESIAADYSLPLFKLLITISLYAVAKYSWGIGDLINNSSRLYWGFGLYEWTNLFYHPFGGHIFNYLILCISMGLYGVAIYASINTTNIHLIESAPKKARYVMMLLCLLSLILLTVSPLFKNIHLIRYFFIALLPILYLLALKYKTILFEWMCLLWPKNLIQRIPKHIKEAVSLNFILNKKSLIFITALLLVFVSLEPLNILKGPVYLFNEYDINDETYINGVLVNNDVFLNNFQKSNPALRNAISSAEKISGKSSQMDSIRNIAMSTIFSNRLPDVNLLPAKYDRSMVEKQAINYDTLKAFYLDNYFEYLYYNFSRGQMNHIGHVLNPLNEYQLGKPIRDIYIQYGFGYTFLLKRTMELFGGISIENYYKCYIYYVIYFILFLLMTTILFRNTLYNAIAFAFLCVAYYYQQFIAFILAPGIIPAIHLFDVFVLLFLVLYFRKSNPMYFAMAVLAALAGIVMNKQFGSILTIALIMSTLLYSLENIEKKEKRRGLLITGITSVLAVLVYRYTVTGALGETFPYFLTGLFSWPAHPLIISFTLIYISISYIFFFLLKNCRHYLKYVFVLVSIYTQGLFLYFYWSGLSNHLPTVMPFLGLQLLLMVFIAQNILFKDKERLRALISVALKVALIVLLFLIVHYSLIFYRQKSFVMNNFVKHAAYSWNFEKAKIVTTIDPKPIQESILLIQRYSPQDRGIFILSKYDNLLPFLADRYSRMPFFEMTWHLLSEKESRETIATIRAADPEYLFYDTNLADNTLYDKWSKLFYGPWEPERDSRLGRYRELQRVFESVSSGYSLVEKGALISVYQRNSLSGTGK